LVIGLLVGGLAALTGVVVRGPDPGTTWADARTYRCEFGGAAMDVAVDRGDLALVDSEILAWVGTAARSVTAYYGRFPVKEVSIAIHRVDGDHVGSGVTGRTGISVDLGSRATRDALAADWVLTHEMIHLAFPEAARKHHWIEEGIPTYVEPLARLRAGQLTPEKVWGDLVRDLQQGLPREGDLGLDETHTWARTYWGGAIFCILADVAIHEQTGNRRGLDDALRGILDEGGSIRVHWEIVRALEAGDRATGVPVLAKLYDSMKASPVSPDLDGLFRDLGVRVQGRDVTFDETAPRASVRRAIEGRRER
jgi:hypothetical protein